MNSIKNIFLISFLLVMMSLFQFSLANGKTVPGRKILYWIDPMEPTVHYNKPGKSRMGMEVVPIYADEETNHAQHFVIKISPAIVDNLGVRTAAVTQGDFSKSIETVGYMSIDENKMSHIHVYTDGWIKKLFIKTVDEPAMKGQLLFQLYSPALVNAQEEYLIALNTHQHDLIQASQKKLLALGIDQKQINQITATKKADSLINVYAPQNGIVTKLNVREGMQVTPKMTIMSLADLSKVWLMAEVYESQASFVAVGQEVEAQLSSLPGKILKGRVDYVYPQIDPVTRTLKVRLCFDNPNNLLKPGMYANVRLLATPKHHVISIPLEALIRTGQGDRVIVALGQGRFEPRIVTAGIESGNRVEILAGLKPGESVVTSAQFLIDSEANLKGALERLSALPSSASKTVTNGLSPDTQNTQSSMLSSTKMINMKSASTMTQPIKNTSITGVGIIKAVQPATHKLTISHQPISALHWPAMTMDFTAADQLDLSPLKPGDSIQFQLKESGDEFVITHITKRNE